MSPRLRVAVVARAVTPLHGVGGLERSVHDLVRHLAGRDVQVTLITPPAWVTAHDGANPFGSPLVTLSPVPYVTFPLANRRGTTILDRSTAYPVFGLRAGRLAAGLVSTGRVDVVHGFGASALGYALARGRLRAPLVLNPQGLEEFGGTGAAQPWLKHAGYWPLRRAVRRTARAADAIIATDRSIVPTIARHLHPRSNHVHVIPNGIDVPAADALAASVDPAALRQRHGLGPDETILLSVGRLEANKGFDVLVEALKRSSRAGGPLRDKWRWVLVGAGPYGQQIEAAVNSAGLADRVLYAGRVSDAELHAWYGAAAIFVHPTRYEGSSLVTLEAMARRRAVIATRAGGLPDKVRPGENGWLVDPGDAQGLASAIADALSDRPRLAAMGAASRAIVEREFAWSVLVELQLRLYEQLLSR